MTFPDPVSTVTLSYRSNDVVDGAGYAGTTCVDYPEIPIADPCGVRLDAALNFDFGTDAVFSFVTPAQMIESLRALLSDLDVPKGPGPKLDDMLRNALKALDKDKGKTSRACTELDHFVKEVEHRGKKIGSTDTATILAKASDIETALGC